MTCVDLLGLVRPQLVSVTVNQNEISLHLTSMTIHFLSTVIVISCNAEFMTLSTSMTDESPSLGIDQLSFWSAAYIIHCSLSTSPNPVLSLLFPCTQTE